MQGIAIHVLLFEEMNAASTALLWIGFVLFSDIILFVLSLKTVYKSVSAFAPIANPMDCPWGHKALGGYLGPDQETWKVGR